VTELHAAPKQDNPIPRECIDCSWLWLQWLSDKFGYEWNRNMCII